MSVKFDDFLQEQLQDPEFRREYEAIQPEKAIIQEIIDDETGRKADCGVQMSPRDNTM